MRDELEEKLYNKFPKIYKKTQRDFDISCGDGWNSVLDGGSSVIQNHIDYTRKQRAQAIKYNRALKRALAGDSAGLMHYFSPDKEPAPWTYKTVSENIEEAKYREVRKACPQVVAVQVKEKFGGLRFYFHGGDEYVNGVVSMMEAACSFTCEVCAKPGVRRSGGWIRTLCDSCDAEIKKNK